MDISQYQQSMRDIGGASNRTREKGDSTESSEAAAILKQLMTGSGGNANEAVEGVLMNPPKKEEDGKETASAHAAAHGVITGSDTSAGKRDPDAILDSTQGFDWEDASRTSPDEGRGEDHIIIEYNGKTIIFQSDGSASPDQVATYERHFHNALKKSPTLQDRVENMDQSTLRITISNEEAPETKNNPDLIRNGSAAIPMPGEDVGHIIIYDKTVNDNIETNEKWQPHKEDVPSSVSYNESVLTHEIIHVTDDVRHDNGPSQAHMDDVLGQIDEEFAEYKENEQLFGGNFDANESDAISDDTTIILENSGTPDLQVGLIG